MAKIITKAGLAAAALAVLALMLPASAPADDPPAKPLSAKEKTDAFVKAVEASEALSDEQRQKGLEAVSELRTEQVPEDVVVTEALRVMYPDFAGALAALGDERIDKAVPELKKLAEADDPFLAAESAYFLARAHMIDENYEAALPLLEKCTGPLARHTPHAGEALFLQGITQAGTLKRKEAVASLSRFLNEHPDAPERMRIGAWQQLERLRTIEKGSIADVHEHMEYSRRRLARELSGETTRETQQQIVAMLDKLIEEAEKRGGT